MKQTRQQQILSIIKENIILTQEDLQNALLNLGYNVTQSTVSRDIKELGLAKAVDGTGVQRYIVHSVKKVKTGSHDYIFSSSVISVATFFSEIWSTTVEIKSPSFEMLRYSA